MLSVGPPELLIVSLILLHFVLGLWVAIDAARLPDWAFQRAGSSKSLWIVLGIGSMLVCFIIGSLVVAIIWFASIRPQVLAAAHQGPTPPPATSGGPWQPPPPSRPW